MANSISFGDIKLDYEGIGTILRSNELENLCVSYAEKYMDSDKRMKSFIGFDRAHAIVYDNARHPGE